MGGQVAKFVAALQARHGAAAGYNGMLLPLDIFCNKSYSIAGPGSACRVESLKRIKILY